MSAQPESTMLREDDPSKVGGEVRPARRGHPRHDSYNLKWNERVLAGGCGAKAKAPHLGGILPQQQSVMVRNGVEGGPFETGEVEHSGGAECACVDSHSGRWGGGLKRRLNEDAVCSSQAMAVENPEARGGSSSSVRQTISGRYMEDSRMRKTQRDKALQTGESGPKRNAVLQCCRRLGDVTVESAHVQRRWANGIWYSRPCAITVAIDIPAMADLQTEESGPKRSAVLQGHRRLGDVTVEDAHMHRRWANGIRNSRPFAIAVVIDIPATANLQTEESGSKRSAVLQCHRWLGDVTVESNHVQRGWANGIRNSRSFALTVVIDLLATADPQTKGSGPK